MCRSEVIYYLFEKNGSFAISLGEAVVGGGKQHQKKNGVTDGRNRKALGDIGNLGNARGVVVEAKPNRPITRFFSFSRSFIHSFIYSFTQ